MATVSFYPTDIDADRTPKAGYMTIGKNSSGTNRTARVTFPALSVPGEISSVRLCFSWDNTAAGEGFSTGAYHEAKNTSGTIRSFFYYVSGSSGSINFAFVHYFLPGEEHSYIYNTSDPFVLVLKGSDDSASSTSKAYIKNTVHLEVDYDPYGDNTSVLVGESPKAMSVTGVIIDETVYEISNMQVIIGGVLKNID